ncbi:MAG: UDP-3-O-(3-hydroxymyristoyl)glucosamine N-acyltransferase [Paracoccus sp. (in: a-proteobacteria)]|uniref:UDP-3-O-(3-hydroxymyristoyl)glucosamine N-acyltransferase n=1 Tax=Paracoccus sp. TaxID=267 RepID=UPI0026DFF9C4|nr:UDP-3-O-(3-hydroxymyristoyl)glucosamine N-acyltransferase [Paracoccus sp. (in: a-proteobacteria)]MDO5622176.1 UDP-3-O-(3-hydroxymyristoyl)glucosamine N-acyltransferase [Paracoccus sp. (in: a-proteobacteria)]
MTLTIAELARALDARAWGETDLPVTGAAEPSDADEGVIALAMAPKYAEALKSGSIAILAEGMDPQAYGLRAAIFAPRPRLVMAGLTRAFDPGADLGVISGVHPTAVIDETAQIGEGAVIGPFAVIGAGVRIGARARIATGVSIGRDSRIGDDVTLLAGARLAHGMVLGHRVWINPGAIIGADGHSFVTPEKSGVEDIRETLGERAEIRQQSWTRIHSLGGVELGDDVEIGANATVDRGTVRATRIGAGTKIDNLNHIGHNVQIGRDCLFAGQCGVAGSTRIGDRVVLGGQCGVSDNIFIGDDVIAGGASKIYTNVPAGRVILGSPAVKMETQVTAQKNIRRLPRLFEQVARLQETVTKLMDKT